MATAIHPMQVFGKGFEHWKKNLWACAAIVAVLYVPFVVLAVLGGLAMAASAKAGVIAAAVAVFIVLLFAGIVVFNAAPVALILAVMKSRQEKPKVIAAIKAALSHIWRFFATNLLAGLVVAGVVATAGVSVFAISQTVFKANAVAGGVLIGLIILAGLIALVFFGLRLSMSGYICVLEKKGPVISLNRSFALVRKHLAPVAGVFLLCVAVSLAVMAPGLIAAVLVRAAGQPLNALMRIAAELFLTPFFVNVTLVLFDELKSAESAAAGK